MAKVTVQLPSMLKAAADGQGQIDVDAETLSGAMAALVKRCPALRSHLFEAPGKYRRHVLCFHNDNNTRWLEGEDPRLKEGDTITILQAVSGG